LLDRNLFTETENCFRDADTKLAFAIQLSL
jgi:hypothetical protein